MKTEYEQKHGFEIKDDQFETSQHTGGIINRKCVKVARTPNGVALRDSKDAADPTDKTTLFFNRNEWQAFLKGAKEGQFDI